MAEVHVEAHSSPIKTPQQLIVVVVLAFLVPIGLIVMLTQLVTGGGAGKSNPALSDEAVARRLQPVGTVVVVDPNAPRVERSGQAVVEAVCAACHKAGLLNAPKIGDKAAWGKLIAEGQERLTADAIKGVRQMPPRGGAPDLSDVEFARAVAYMANQAGAKWKEPEPKAAPAAKAAAPAAQAPVAAAEDKGRKVYEATCQACHAAGVAGAPKAGDRAAWTPRLKGGKDALYASALKGKNAMPPKGGNISLPDADVKAAVDFMVGLVK